MPGLLWRNYGINLPIKNHSGTVSYIVMIVWTKTFVIEISGFIFPSLNSKTRWQTDLFDAKKGIKLTRSRFTRFFLHLTFDGGQNKWVCGSALFAIVIQSTDSKFFCHSMIFCINGSILKCQKLMQALMKQLDKTKNLQIPFIFGSV